MIKNFGEYNINESYKKPTEYDTNLPGLNIPIYTYVDKVFDHLVQIVCDVNNVSEKDFTNWDNTKKYIEMYFDNNQEVLLDIDQYLSSKGRFQLCAEHLFNKHFQNDREVLEKISTTDYKPLMEKKKQDHKDVRSSVKNSKTLPKEMKEKIEPLLTNKSKYNKGIVTGLVSPNIKGKGKSFASVGLGADKDGFFVHTHRARSKSYTSPDKIPNDKIVFIESTG